MSFPWYEAKRLKPDPAKRDEMLRHEMEDRAALLLRLGYSKNDAKARLRANVAWDYELRGKPRSVETDREIDKLVDAVYRRGGGSGPPTV
jgi:hypothetical protein